jgi:hypothetical protein
MACHKWTKVHTLESLALDSPGRLLKIATNHSCLIPVYPPWSEPKWFTGLTQAIVNRR